MRSRLQAVCLASSAVLAAPVLAQEAPQDAQASQPAIEEIVVTAQKRVQSVQDVPVSVAAIGGEQLDDLKIDDTNDLSNLVANLQVNQINGDGAPVFALRGVTMNDYSVNQSSPVAVYTDEVYAGPTVLQPIQMFDLERIEVLRGPQGTLYGRNSTGGAVNIVTKAPSFENGGHLRGGIGNFDRYEVEGAAEYAFVDDVLAARFAGMWAQADGWFKNLEPNVKDANSTDEWAIRASLLWRPTDAIEAILRFSSGRARPTEYGIYADNIGKIGLGLGADVYDLYNALGAANPPDYDRAGLGRFELEANRTTKRKRETDQASLHVNWQLTDSLTLTSVTAWTQGDFLNPEDTDGAPLEMIEIDYFGDGDQWSQDLRVTSSFGGPFDFVGGIYYANEQLDIATDFKLFTDVDFNLNGGLDPNDCADPLLASLDPPAALPAPSASPDGQAADLVLDGLGLGLRLRDFAALGCIFRNSFDQERRSIAGYFDGTLAVLERTTLLFGVRVTNDETKVKGFRTFAEGAGVELFDTIPLTGGTIDDTEVTGRIGVEQRFGEDVLAYVTYSRGYRSGAFNAQAFFDPSEFSRVEPETLDAIELGVKSTMAGGRAQLNGAFFYYRYKDQQLVNVDPVTVAQTLINIDKSVIFGAELELLAQLTERWRLSGGVGWLNAEAKKGVVSGIDVGGDTLPNSPDFNVGLASDLDVFETGFGTFSWHIDGNFVGEQYFTLPHIRRVLIDDYALFNTRIGFRSADERWEAGFWVKNLGDEFYQTSIVALDGFGYDYSHIGPPRTYGADLTFRF